jgi:hypothetical protein
MSLVFLLALAASVQQQTEVLQKIVKSGRVVEIATPISERVEEKRQLAPGAPPVLSFRLLDGRVRHRFGDLDLVLDDAGH